MQLTRVVALIGTFAGPLWASTALAAPRGMHTEELCAGTGKRCHLHVLRAADGTIVHDVVPLSLGDNPTTRPRSCRRSIISTRAAARG